MLSLRTAAVAAAVVLLLPALAQAQYFGRNKVQYRPFDFRIIATENFDVHYYDEERTASLDAARMVERSYARLSHVLQHEFRERKPLILYASHTDFQQTNTLHGLIDESTGGVTESAKSRTILPFTGDYASFDHVLTHELVHGFQFDVILGRSVVTDANPFTARLPLWFMEGMAEYLSIGRVDPHTQSWLRDAVLTGYIRSIDEMSMRDDYLSYRFGQSLWAYIGAKWGDEVVGILLQKAPRIGIPAAFERTLGITLDELSDEWLGELRRTYLPQLAGRAQPHRIAERLTHHDDVRDPWFLSPAISPDGTQMVYLSQRDGFFFDLWLADARTGEVRRKLVEGATSEGFESLRFMNSSASFSPDGRFVAFAAQSGGRDLLYVYDIERGDIVRKLRFSLNAIANPGWSPDGTQLVFTGLDGGLSDLFVTTLDGALRRLTNDRYAELHPAWSPDGRTIAFATDRGPRTDFDELAYGNMRIALHDLQDGSIRVLPQQDEGKNINPVWSPDGGTLLWVGDRTGTNDLYRFDLATGKLERITDLLSGVIAIGPLSPVLSWSRSDRLLFTYFEQAGYNVYALDDPRSLPARALIDAAPAVATAAPPHATNGDAPGGSLPPLARAAEPRSATGSFYREGAEFRPSDALDAAADAPAPISVLALLDSAAHALPDVASFELRDYDAKLTADAIGRPTIGVQVGGHYGNGLHGGSFVALSDMLGNHNLLLAANLNGSFADASLFGGYSFLKRRANLNVAILQQPLYRYLGGGYGIPLEIDGETHSVAANVFARDVVRGAQGMIAYPFSRFRRVELGVAGYHYTSDVLYRGYFIDTREPLDITRRLDRMAYLQPQASLIFDNTLFGWTGPIVGRRYRLQVSRTFGDLRFTEGMIDFRNYINIAQTAVFATRVIGLTRRGSQADRFSLYWGGPYFLRGYAGDSFDGDGGECERSSEAVPGGSLGRCPVRDQLIGSNAAVASAELRVPVITELQIGFLGTFPAIDGVAFVDGGIAWQNAICLGASALDRYRCPAGQSRPVHLVWRREQGQDPLFYRQPLFSYGVGLRMNVFYTVLRLDYAVALNRPGRTGFGEGMWSLSFGPSF